jgi:hypothetical protein
LEETEQRHSDDNSENDHRVDGLTDRKRDERGRQEDDC